MQDDTTGSEPKQITIFDEDLVALPPDMGHLIAEDKTDLITKDPIFLSDVPILADSNVKKIKIKTLDAKGQLREEERNGKIIERKGPHPTYVLVGDTIVRKDDVRPGSVVRPYMVDIITTVIYDSGVLQQSHLDVFFYLMHKAYQHYEKTGIASGEVRFTRTEVLEALSRTVDGRSFKMIDQAITALSGLKVKKYYIEQLKNDGGLERDSSANEPISILGEDDGISEDLPVASDDVPHAPNKHVRIQRTELLSNLIIGITTETRIGSSAPDGERRGRKGKSITIELNPLLIRSMCGQTNNREYIVRSLNFTRNQKYESSIEKQLDRMLQARLERQKTVRMPLVEIYIGCLGGSVEDLQKEFAYRWRRRRAQIIGILKAWEETGFLSNVQTFVPRRRLKEKSVPRSMTLYDDRGERKETIEINLPEFASENDEWISCEKGENFYVGKPCSREVFAREIVESTVDHPGQVAQILEAFDLETIVTIGHRRLRDILAIVGDRQIRMPTTAWLSKSFPRPRIEMLVQWQTDLELFKQDKASKSEQIETIPALFAEARDKKINSRMEEIRPRINFENEVAGELKCAPELRTAYGMAMERIIRQNSLDRKILDPMDRMIYDDLQKKFDSANQVAITVALRVVGAMEWATKVEAECDLLLPKFGESMENHREIAREAFSKFKSAFAITRAMRGPGKHQWESLVGTIIERRLMELAVEARLL